MSEANNNTGAGEECLCGGGWVKQDEISTMLNEIGTHMKATDDSGINADNASLFF